MSEQDALFVRILVRILANNLAVILLETNPRHDDVFKGMMDIFDKIIKVVKSKKDKEESLKVLKNKIKASELSLSVSLDCIFLCSKLLSKYVQNDTFKYIRKCLSGHIKSIRKEVAESYESRFEGLLKH
ncbi:MAG: hypothetical protein QXS37_03935 [Candidatus Aenigmatarchaeota archaeon]